MFQNLVISLDCDSSLAFDIQTLLFE